MFETNKFLYIIIEILFITFNKHFIGTISIIIKKYCISRDNDSVALQANFYINSLLIGSKTNLITKNVNNYIKPAGIAQIPRTKLHNF